MTAATENTEIKTLFTLIAQLGSANTVQSVPLVLASWSVSTPFGKALWNRLRKYAITESLGQRRKS
jgi:hypothetical protein